MDPIQTYYKEILHCSVTHCQRSGATKQLGARSNLAMQGPPETEDRSTKDCQISNIKEVFLLAKLSLPQHIKTFITGVYGSFL